MAGQPDSFYFEYEISLLGRELPILVLNPTASFRLAAVDVRRRPRPQATSAIGGTSRPGGGAGWRAEVFIPYDCSADAASPPTGTAAPLYRMDYDQGRAAWDCPWPQFSRVRKFGVGLTEPTTLFPQSGDRGERLRQPRAHLGRGSDYKASNAMSFISFQSAAQTARSSPCLNL